MSNRSTLLLDLDNVCCPFDETFIDWWYEHTGILLPVNDSYNAYDFEISQYLLQPGIFGYMPSMPNCFEVLAKHSVHFNYVVVTSRPALHHLDTVDWVEAQLPCIDDVIFCESYSKWRVRGDAIIEDNPHVLKSVQGLPITSIKMVRNYNLDAPSHFEVHNWLEMDTVMAQLAYTLR